MYYQLDFNQSIEIIQEETPLVAVEALIKIGFIDSTKRKLTTVQKFLEENQQQ